MGENHNRTIMVRIGSYVDWLVLKIILTQRLLANTSSMSLSRLCRWLYVIDSCQTEAECE
jgi:hypothetical protein